MDLSNLSERDRKTVEIMEFKKADFKIIRGLNKKGYSPGEIAEMMGCSKDYVWGRLPLEQRFPDEDWTAP